MTLPISLIVAHYLGDWLLQSDWMALNKSKSNLALGVHVLVVTLVYGFWATYHLPVVQDNPRELQLGLFVGICFLTHFVTDWITSRVNAILWQRELRHWFFCMIGLDQVIHYVTLALTIRYLS